MTSSHPLPAPCQWFSQLARPPDRRSAPRLALLFLGALLARGRRAVTSWIRAAGLSGRVAGVSSARPRSGAVAAGVSPTRPQPPRSDDVHKDSVRPLRALATDSESADGPNYDLTYVQSARNVARGEGP